MRDPSFHFGYLALLKRRKGGEGGGGGKYQVSNFKKGGKYAHKKHEKKDAI